MKKLLVLFITIFIYNIAIGQEDKKVIKPRPMPEEVLAYKPLTDFGKDTAAFLKYNFTERAEQYKGKTIGEILKDAKIPPKSLLPSPSIYTGEVDGIRIYFSNVTSTEKSNNASKPLYIFIYCDLESKVVDAILRKYRHDKWVQQHYNFFQHVKAKAIISLK